MICQECGYKNKYRKDEAKYCANCGAPLHKRKENKIRETGKRYGKGKRYGRSKNSPNASNTFRGKWYGYGATTLFVSFLIYFLIVPSDQNSDKNNRRAIEQKSGNPVIELKVFDLASKFACACGGCNEDPLDKCECEYAMKERSFIRSRLENSFSDEAIIEAMNKKYGGLKEKS